jgi:hypothetical protein
MVFVFRFARDHGHERRGRLSGCWILYFFAAVAAFCSKCIFWFGDYTSLAYARVNVPLQKIIRHTLTTGIVPRETSQ